MRELTVDELNAVVGGTPPLGDDGLPGETDPRDMIIGDYFSYGYGEMGFDFWGEVAEMARRVIEEFTGTAGRAERETFMQHCASQGKTAVFTSGGGGVEVSADPNAKKVTLKANTGGAQMRCQ